MTGQQKTEPIAKNYTSYLENEMAIMGILSTFCVIAVGACITVLSGTTKEHGPWFRSFWHDQGPFILSGMTAMLLSGFQFYRQRSILSYFVGQIYLGLYSPELADGSVHRLHERANDWFTWRFYRIGFLLLFTAAAFFARVGVSQVLNPCGRISVALVNWRRFELIAPWVTCLVLSLGVCLAFGAFPDDDHPYGESLSKPALFFQASKRLISGGLE